MKKLVIRIVLGLIVLAVLAVVVLVLFLDSAVKRGVETVGPMLTKVDVKLNSASISLLSGSGKVRGLVVGNPEGFKTPSAIQVGTASLALNPGSLLSDKIVVRSINVQGPEITYETDLKSSNLGKILANLQSASPEEKPQQPAPSQESTPGKKLQVDEFIIQGGKVHVSVTALGGKSATVPLPEIRLKDLGQGPEGITPAELTRQVLQTVLESASKEAAGAVANLGKDAVNLAKDLGSSVATNGVNKVTRSIGDLFKKKQ